MSAQVLISAVHPSDIPELVALAHETWHKHYPSIITPAQIDYMLSQRYSEPVIRSQLDSDRYWWDQLRADGKMVAFAATELTDHPGEMKLDKLYVQYELRREGFGSRLLAHVEARARSLGCHRLYLQVNKNNVSAIGAYQKNGFVIADSIVVDIGGGFVMDDYILEKRF